MKWFHRHKWKPTSVNHIERRIFGRFWQGSYVPAPEGIRKLMTFVLYRCECGEVKQTELDGLWTLEDMAGPISDSQFLKEVGVKL